MKPFLAPAHRSRSWLNEAVSGSQKPFLAPDFQVFLLNSIILLFHGAFGAEPCVREARDFLVYNRELLLYCNYSLWVGPRPFSWDPHICGVGAETHKLNVIFHAQFINFVESVVSFPQIPVFIIFSRAIKSSQKPRLEMSPTELQPE
jgi:hypothetical protein